MGLWLVKANATKETLIMIMIWNVMGPRRSKRTDKALFLENIYIYIYILVFKTKKNYKNDFLTQKHV